MNALLALALLGAAAAPAFDELWDYGDPAGTEAAFRTHLAEVAPGQPAAYGLELRTQIARAQGLQEEYAAALATLDEVDAAEDVDARVRVRSLLERGRVHRSSGDPPASIPYFERAFEAAQAAGLEALAVDAAHMLAIALPEKADQVRWNERALELARASEDPAARRWRGSLLNNLGWTYHDGGEPARALELFREAQAFREEQGKTGPIRIARWSVARALRSLGKLAEARAEQEALLAEFRAEGEEDGFVYEELAELTLAQEGPVAARPWFRKAHQALKGESWLEAARLERMRLLGGRGETP